MSYMNWYLSYIVEGGEAAVCERFCGAPFMQQVGCVVVVGNVIDIIECLLVLCCTNGIVCGL